jgi:hypothetical protein
MNDPYFTISPTQAGHSTACPDFGTETCIECEHGDDKALDDCDYNCVSCEKRHECSCSKEGWHGRQSD